MAATPSSSFAHKPQEPKVQQFDNLTREMMASTVQRNLSEKVRIDLLNQTENQFMRVEIKEDGADRYVRCPLFERVIGKKACRTFSDKAYEATETISISRSQRGDSELKGEEFDDKVKSIYVNNVFSSAVKNLTDPELKKLYIRAKNPYVEPEVTLSEVVGTLMMGSKPVSDSGAVPA